MGREVPKDQRLYVNTVNTHVNYLQPVFTYIHISQNAPFSAIVCGLQGSGKSHTMSVLLENMLIPDYDQIGALKQPLCGLVLHYGQGGPSSRPSEAAWVGVSQFPDVKTPKIRVYASPSSLNTMRAVYAPLEDSIKVRPLFFDETELDAESFLSMMAVGSSDSAPLYIQIILVRRYFSTELYPLTIK